MVVLWDRLLRLGGSSQSAFRSRILKGTEQRTNFSHTGFGRLLSTSHLRLWRNGRGGSLRGRGRISGGRGMKAWGRRAGKGSVCETVRHTLHFSKHAGQPGLRKGRGPSSKNRQMRSNRSNPIYEACLTALSIRARHDSLPRISSVSNTPKPTALPVTATRSAWDNLADLDPFALNKPFQRLVEVLRGEILDLLKNSCKLDQQRNGFFRLHDTFSETPFPRTRCFHPP